MPNLHEDFEDETYPPEGQIDAGQYVPTPEDWEEYEKYTAENDVPYAEEFDEFYSGE